MSKKLLGILLSLVLAVSMLGASALAAESGPVAQVGEQEYFSLQEAINAAQDDGTVTLLRDVELNQPITVYDTYVVTLDTNEKTVSYVATEASAATMLTVSSKANLTLTGGGTITFYATNPDTDWDKNSTPPFPGYASNTISNRGVLTVDGVTVENRTGRGGASYAIDNYSGASLTVESGIVRQTGGDIAIRMFASSTTADNAVTINNGTVSGRRAVWVQLTGSDSTKAPLATLTVTDGNLVTTADEGDIIYCYSYGNSYANTKVTIRGGVFTGPDDSIGYVAFGGGYKGDTETVTITGGTYDSTDSIGRWVTADDWSTEGMLAENHLFVANDDGTYTVEELSLSNAPAAIGETPYASLQAAINAAQDDGTVTLLRDVELTAPITVYDTYVVTLDTNEKTVSYVATESSAATMLTVSSKANLTLTGGGTITFYATNPDTDWDKNSTPPFPGYASNTISNRGVLTVDGVTVENRTGRGGASYAIDNYSGASLTVESGIVRQTGGDIAIRMFASSTTADNAVTINNGTVSGRRAVWVQLTGSDSTKAPLATLAVTNGNLVTTEDEGDIIYCYSYGNSFANTNVTISGGVFTGGYVAFGGGYKGDTENVTITGGTYDSTDSIGRWVTADDWSTEGMLAENHLFVANEDGTYTVEELSLDNAPAAIGETPYMTLADAIAEGGEVKVLKNIELTETITVNAGQKVTLDLNGMIISGVSSEEKASCLINNKGDLTIKDSVGGGKITSEVQNPDLKDIPGYANNTINNGGTLTVLSGTIENTGEGAACYPIDTNSGSANTKVTIKGGKIDASEESYAIRLWAGSTTYTNEVIIEGGELTGYRAVWVQLPGNNSEQAPYASLTVKGGTLTSVDETYNSAIYCRSWGQSYANTSVTILDGVINGDVALSGPSSADMNPAETVSISGGTFNSVNSGVYTYSSHLTGFITGGSFSIEPAAAYLAEGYHTIVENDLYKVVFTGLKQNDNGAWEYYVNSVLQADYTGLVGYNEALIYVVNGVWATGYTGMVQSGEGWYYIAEGVQDTEFAGLVEHEGILYYVSNGMMNTGVEGMIKYENDWYYVTGGTAATGYTGLALSGGTYYYVVNGKLDVIYAGMVEHGGDLYYVSNGGINTEFVGLAAHEGEWYYMTNGVVAKDYTGLVWNGNWFYITDGVVDWDYTGLVLNGEQWIYIVEGQMDVDYTGMAQIGEDWYYITEGVQNTEFAGLVEHEGILYYVSNGTVNTGVEGMVAYEGDWYYVTGGTAATDYTGLALSGGIYYYVVNGKLDVIYAGMVEHDGSWVYVSYGQKNTDFEGLVEYEGEWCYVANGVLAESYTGLVWNSNWFYVTDGVVDWEYTGLVQNGEQWIYIVEGQMDADYTGMVEYYDNLFYVSNGEMNTEFVGLVDYEGEWCYVANGVLVEDYTGLVWNYNNWFYVVDGVVDWDYTGLVQNGEQWIYIVDGQMDVDYAGLVEYYGNLFYVSNGEMDTNFAGLVEYEGVQYYVAGGAPATGYTGLALSDGTYYYVVNGVLAEDYTGLVEYYGNLFYIIEGALDSTFVDIVEHDGQRYYVAGGAVASGYSGLALGSDNWYLVFNGVVAADYVGLAYHGGGLYYINHGVLDWNYTGIAYTPDGAAYNVVGGIAQIQ